MSSQEIVERLEGLVRNDDTSESSVTALAILTVGHSTRSIAELVALLHRVSVDLLVDVRSVEPLHRLWPGLGNDHSVDLARRAHALAAPRHAIIVLPWHKPALLVEQAASLDLLSGGRLDFGIGKGWPSASDEGRHILIKIEAYNATRPGVLWLSR